MDFDIHQHGIINLAGSRELKIPCAEREKEKDSVVPDIGGGGGGGGKQTEKRDRRAESKQSNKPQRNPIAS